MDDKAYTCFYCHSILPYDVCISGTHFCLQATNAIEFWGNVVKIASTNSVDEQELCGEGVVVSSDVENNLKQEEQLDQHNTQHNQGNEEESVFAEMDSEDNVSPEPKATCRPLDDSILESQDMECDSVKPMTWRLKMIALIKQRPPLYDKRLPLTERTFPIRAKLWKEVYEGLNGLVPIELLPKRFKVLRDRYNKELKRRKLGHLPRKQWSLFKYLDFLSHAKNKICVRKMSQVNGERTEEEEDQDRVLESTDCGDKVVTSATDEDLYKEDFELKKKLVQLVGERPPLYDCRLPRPVRVAENKVKLWREVYEALQGVLPLVDLPRKFKSLRDRYMKEKKKLDTNEPTTNWPLMEYMTYLDDVAYIRSSQDNHTSVSVVSSPTVNTTALIITSDKTTNHQDKNGVVDVKSDSQVMQTSIMSPLRILSSSGVQSPPPRQDHVDIIVPDDIEDHRELEEGEPEALLAALNQRDRESLSPANNVNNSNTTSSPHGKGEQKSVNSNRLKKLDLLEYYDKWTEDDFFGAYLVRLMKKLPLEERLKLHIDIINMIKKSLANADLEHVKSQLLD